MHTIVTQSYLKVSGVCNDDVLDFLLYFLYRVNVITKNVNTIDRTYFYLKIA